MQFVVPSAVDVDVTIKIIDATDGSPETGVTSASAGLALWWRKGATGAVTAITEADHTNLTDAHSDGKIKHISDGLYRVSLPDAAVPTAEGEVTWVGGAVTGMQVIPAAIVGRVVPLAPTVAGRALDVSAGGNAGVDWANVETPGSTVALSATTVGVLTTYTGNTPQTGDAFARIGANGAGLTGVPWNASWDAEVQSEAADALTAYGASTYAGGDTAGTTTLLSRITALIQTKAEADTAHGLLATAAALASAAGDVSTILSRVTGAVALATSTTAAAIRAALGMGSANLDTQIDALPTAAEIAVGVWDEALSGHATAGTAGAALTSAGGAADPLTNTVPGSYTAGTAGYVLGLINAGRIAVTFTGPVLSAGAMEIVPGDDYHETDGVDAVWTWEDTTASYTSATATFYAERDGSTDFSKALQSISKTGSTVTARMRLTAAESVLLTSGAPWKWQVRVTWSSGRSTTKLRGLLGVVERIGT